MYVQLTRFPIALFFSCLLHVGFFYLLSNIYTLLKAPTGHEIYFVDIVKEEPNSSPPSPPKSMVQEELSNQVSEPKIKPPPSRKKVPQPVASPLSVPSSNAHTQGGSSADQASSAHHGLNSVSEENIPLPFKQAVLSKLESLKKYPLQARRRGEEGRGVLRIEIDRDGNLLSRHLELSTGFSILDEELISLADRASPYPKPPESLRGEKISLKIPVSFRLH